MLLVGPPGSGKTHFVLSAVEAALREGRDRNTVLIVPTASMAEHLINTLARRGVAVPTRVVRTIAAFVNDLTPELTEAEPAVESWLLQGLLEEANSPAFREIAERDGFRAQVLAVMRELMSADCDPRVLKPFTKTLHQAEFLKLFDAFQQQLRDKGYAIYGEKHRQAADRIRREGLGDITEVYLDGFFQLSTGEHRLISALAERADKLVATVPAGVESTYPDLPVERLETINRPRPTAQVVKSRSPEHEIEDIARRILEANRPFHECGVVVRTPEVYGPLIETVFERFGIPFRMRAAAPLAGHGAVSYLRELLRGIAEGFSEIAMLALLGRQWCPVGLTAEADTYDFEVRKKLPGGGIEFLLRQAERFPKVENFLKGLTAFKNWPREKRPAALWKERVCDLQQRYLRLPEVTDGLSMPEVLEIRCAARAMQGFAQAAEQAAKLWPESEIIAFGDYFDALGLCLDTTPLPVSDGRRNVVNVITVYEARQWELPVVFVCGLIEKQFPQHPTQDLFFSNADRGRMKERGIPLRTLAEREEEERFLFEVATTRATESLFLTYPESDEGGRVNIRSFFIETSKDDDASAPNVRVQQTPADFEEPRQASLAVEDVRNSIVARHGHFRPSSIETYLKCPFLFFGQQTLKLEGSPEAPEWRINHLLAGTIVHETLRQWANAPEMPIAEVLADVFGEVCERESIQPSFRTAVTFNNMRADLEAFAREERERLGPDVRERLFETTVEFVEEEAGDESFQVRGRIDRYELFEENLAVVVDYKYSAKAGMEKLIKAHNEGRLVQGALYLTGLEQVRGVKPAGIRYLGLRGDVNRIGWVSTELGEAAVSGKERSVSPEELREILQNAQEITARAVEEIRSGRMEAAPYDLDPCRRYCEMRDVCRIRP